MSNTQIEFDALIDRYNSGIEPLESWTTEDLEILQQLVTVELAERDTLELFDIDLHEGEDDTLED